MIFHITLESVWVAQKNLSYFAPDSLAKEGFIHCATSEQLPGVLHRYFEGQTGLVVLYLAEDKLEFPIVYEQATQGEFFPHLFGAINKDAVIKVERIN